MESVEVSFHNMARLLRYWYALRVWFHTYKELLHELPAGMAELRASEVTRKVHKFFENK